MPNGIKGRESKYEPICFAYFGLDGFSDPQDLAKRYGIRLLAEQVKAYNEQTLEFKKLLNLPVLLPEIYLNLRQKLPRVCSNI